MKQIPLTQGKFALVDDEDYEYLMQWKWCARKTSGKFYAVRSVCANRKTNTVLMHRELVGSINGLFVCDHKNGNGLDNQKSNLRKCTQAENSRNSCLRKDNKSGFKGVWWNHEMKKWRVSIAIEGKTVKIGNFSDINEAARHYNKAAFDAFGEFAKLNDVNPLFPTMPVPLQEKHIRRDNKTGCVGVCSAGKKWVAQTTIRGVQKYLGRFKSIEDAAKAIIAAQSANSPDETHLTPVSRRLGQ